MKKLTVEVEKFVCDNCGSEHTDEKEIQGCNVCSKEICTNCSTRANIGYYEIVEDDDMYSLDSYYLKEHRIKYDLCSECYYKIRDRKNDVIVEHQDKMNELIHDFNKKSLELAQSTMHKLNRSLR